MKGKKNSTSGPEKIGGRWVPLALKLGAVLIVLLLLGGGLWAWFFLHKIEKTISSTTTNIINVSKEKIADISLEQVDASQKILLTVTNNFSESLQDEIADIPFDLYSGDETRIKAAILAQSKEHQEHMSETMLTLQEIMQEHLRKEIENNSRELRKIQQDTIGAVLGQVRNGLLLLGFTGMILLGLIVVASVKFLILRRIDKLRKGASQIAAGTYHMRIDTTQGIPDEISEVIDSFNLMAENLSEQEDTVNRYTASLEEEVRHRKKAEESLKHSFEKERQLTNELTIKNFKLVEIHEELKATQSQILQQEKMASVGQLAAGVAHEINNPMGFISSNLGTLKKYVNRLTDYLKVQAEALESQDKEQAQETLKDLRKKLKLDYILEDTEDLIAESQEGAERIKGIVQGLKSFSRVDEAEHKPADINECLESTINIVWNELKYKATVNKEYGDLPLTKCYPQQLNQVFLNILINAAQAIEKQGEIGVNTWQQDDFIFVSISDTGCGISQKNINKLFEPFFTTKEVGKGTGLGLSIAYEIIKKHGGNISVDSEIGKGTTFTIQIPVVE